MEKYQVITKGGEHRFADSPFRIVYVADTGDSGEAYVWRHSCDNSIALTLLNSPSGSGKTTFITNVYQYVQHAPSALRFDFRPDHLPSARCSYGYIPQHPPFGNHWSVRQLLPGNPKFLGAFFPHANTADLLTKRLGQLSGGQKLKLYVCSALEQLSLTGDMAAFIVLDEVFDGLGATEAQRCIHALCDQWKTLVRKPLYVLLVSHLDEAQIRPIDLPILRLGLAVRDESYDSLTVAIYNKT